LLKQNNTLFSIDLRGNKGLCPKINREIALNLLENYTRAGQYMLKGYGESAWIQEQRYFDQKLLIVEIPSNLI
jgi:hypothetical protein